MLHLELKGTPHQNGKLHGSTFKKEIKELVQIRKKLLLPYLVSIDQTEMNKVILDSLNHLKKFPDLYEEIQGISEGAEVPISDILIVNNYTDYRDFGAPKSDEGCSVFSCHTEKEAICGQTWDMHKSATPYILHLSIKGPQPKEVLTVTGCLALAGINSQPVGVFINNMHSRETHEGLIWPALVRKLLDHSSADSALDFLKENLPCSGHNYLICDPKTAINVETTGKRFEVTTKIKETGYSFHTNHYVSELKETEVLDRQSGTTHDRTTALKDYFKSVDSRKISMDKLTRDILAGERVPEVCVTNDKEHGAATCGGILFDLNRRCGFSYSGIVPGKDRHDFNL